VLHSDTTQRTPHAHVAGSDPGVACNLLIAGSSGYAVADHSRGRPGTVLGNGDGNETPRDRVSLLRQNGTTQVPAVVLASSNASSPDR
jgi:hypothetical protein